MMRNLSSAINDFHRMRSQANMEQILARLRGKSADLLSFEEVRRKLKARETSVREMKEIPIDAIVGSVGRYADFTRGFMPRRDSDKDRWAKVVMAADNVGLPPIEVYQIDQAYFVLDGNHRVSAARLQNQTYIMAYVIPVQISVPLTPDVQPDDLIVKAEYADFLDYTRLNEIRSGADLTVSVPGQYTRLEDHIEVHRYWVEEARGHDIPYEEAVGLWYDEAYLPVVEAIRKLDILADFPGRTPTDLYLWIYDHRIEMERELGWNIRPESALANLASRFSTRPRRLAARLSWHMLDTVVPDQLESGPPPGQWRKRHLAARSGDQLFADILVAVGAGAAGWRALDQALVVAQREQGWVHGIHVTGPGADPAGPDAAALSAEFESRCQAAGVKGKLAVQAGEIARVLYERSWWTDLVVISLNYPPSALPITRLASGLRTLLNRCGRPVLAVPPIPQPSPLARVLLAYNNQPKAEEALFVAAHLACQWQSRVTMVSVASGDQAPREDLDRALQILSECHVKAVPVEARGPAPEAILRVAEEQSCDVIVMGGYGTHPMAGAVLASTVDEVLRASVRPVLICR